MENETVRSKTMPDFITNSILCCVTLTMVYKVSLFRCLGGLTYTASEIVFYCLVVILFTAGIVIAAPCHRNTVNTYLGAIFPLGVYAALTYFKDLPVLFIAAGVLAAVFSAVCLVSVLRRRCRTRAQHRDRIYSAVLVPRNMISLFSAMLILPMMIKVILSGCLFDPAQTRADPRLDEWKIPEKCMELVIFTDEEAWSASTRTEKLNALQTMANITATNLGIPHELKLSVGPAGRVTLAQYSEHFCSITFNVDKFDDITAWDALFSLLHECYHSFQFCLVDLIKNVDEKYYNMNEIKTVLKYQAEFADYIDGDSDYYGYEGQLCETDADQYAYLHTDQTIELIKYYSRKKSEE